MGENEFIEFIKNDQNATEYLQTDVLCLEELFYKFQSEVESTLNQINENRSESDKIDFHLTDAPTIGSYAV